MACAEKGPSADAVCYRPLGDMRRTIGLIANERSPSRAATALAGFFKAEV